MYFHSRRVTRLSSSIGASARRQTVTRKSISATQGAQHAAKDHDHRIKRRYRDLERYKRTAPKEHGTEERQPCPYGQRNVILDKAHHGTQLYRGNAEMTSPLKLKS